MNSLILRISSLFVYQFLFEPLQYFIIETTPSIYLGRVISLFIVGGLIYANKSGLLIRSFIKSLTTLPFLPYTLWSVIGGIVALIHFQAPFYKIRFGIIEPLIYLIFISLFIILPKSFLRGEVLLKIPRAFLYTFCLILIFGFLDLICYYFGFNLLNKTLFNTSDIGARFHSFANEPRDYTVACIYYLASLSTFFVSPLVGNKFKKYFRFYLIILIPLAFLSLILTKSFTFIVTALIALITIISAVIIQSIISSFKYKLYKSYLVVTLIGLSLFLILYLSLDSAEFLASIGSRRIFSYLDAFENLRNYLQDGNYDFVDALKLEPRILYQGNIILPLLEFFSPNNASDIYFQFVGNGIGSISELFKTINFSFQEDDIFINSFSQLVRLLYEQGIVGFLFFIYIHFWIIKRSTLSTSSSRLQKSLFFIFSTLLLIAYLVHRRSEYFLFLGINRLYLHTNSQNKNQL